MTVRRAGSALPDVEPPEVFPAARQTAAIVDLDALSENIRQVRKALAPGREVLAVVKAEAYGHGAVEASRVFRKEGACLLGVATAEEAQVLRSAGAKEGDSLLSDAPILLMNAVSPCLAPRVVSLDLETVLWNFEQAQAQALASAAAGRSVRVYFKVDSGMGRLGLSPGEAADFIRKVSGLDRIVPAGLMSHLGQADEEEGAPPTLAQFEVVRSLAESLRKEGILPPLVHTANSAGGLAFLDAPGGLVRCGILLYGCLPRNVRGLSVVPAMSFRSYILQVKPIAAGAPVGYGATYRRETPGKIALAAVGYADGYPRLLSNRADALVGGSRAPVVGRVSMDLIALDVTHLETVREGEEVVLFGAQNEGRILVEELADRADTIPYEILCGVSARVPRLYLKGGRIAGRRVLGGEPKESRLAAEGPA